MRHCQSGKYAFEKAKLSKFFSPLNLDETLPRINIAWKPNKLKNVEEFPEDTLFKIGLANYPFVHAGFRAMSLN